MKRPQGKNALDLIEEATHLLRTAAAATLAVYYLGAIPFILGLLYFWADMSRNPFASQHLAEAALGMAALFLWMKFWQAVFARRLRAQIAALPPPDLGFLDCLRIATTQTVLQSLGLIPIGFCLAGFFHFIPLGLFFALLVAWMLPFFHNVTAIADDSTAGVKEVFKKAWRMWWIWSNQNLSLLAIGYFFGLYVFLNCVTASFMLPGLIKMLFGIESAFTKSPFSMLNTTFFAAMFGLTYLCVDPVLKTLYTLRCFYGESVTSGEDLKAELKHFSPSAQSVTAAIVLLIMVAGTASIKAADDAAAQNGPANHAQPAVQNSKPISTPDLDHAINKTIHERKYTWRMPREKVQDTDADKGIIGRFFDKVANLIRDCAHAVWQWLQDLLDKLFRRRPKPGSSNSSSYGWIMTSQVLLYVLIAAVLAALAISLLRLWHRRRQQPSLVASEPIQPVPDIADENVGADQLPEDGWTQLARELLERGEFRLAMRAFYLASLAHLAQRNLISLARFKSNHEYERELRRRGHSFPDLLSVFDDNLSLFERIWYGMHEVNGELVREFAANVERIKGVG